MAKRWRLLVLEQFVNGVQLTGQKGEIVQNRGPVETHTSQYNVTAAERKNTLILKSVCFECKTLLFSVFWITQAQHSSKNNLDQCNDIYLLTNKLSYNSGAASSVVLS